jgi:Lrp/AsnC family leucine-responsive transcriptional regulator
MDSLDKNILKELQQNARITVSEIGRRIGLSAPAVGKRVQEMEEEGIILGYKTQVDLAKLGLPVQAFVTFKLVSLSHNEFLKWIKTLPQIQECYIVTGSPGAFLRVAVDTTENLGKFIDQLKEHGETNTSVILSKPIHA